MYINCLVSESDVLIDINCTDGQLLTHSYEKVNCKGYGLSHTETNFLSASKEYYAKTIMNKEIKKYVSILKCDQEISKKVNEIQQSPTVIFYAETKEENKDFTTEYLLNSYLSGKKIISLTLLKNFGVALKEIKCKVKDSEDITLYLYQDESSFILKLMNILDPIRNPIVSTIFNIILIGFVLLLAYLVAVLENVQNFHIGILLFLILGLQVGVNWFLSVLKDVYKQEKNELKNSSQILEI